MKTKKQLYNRYFNLTNRVDKLEHMLKATYYNETFKIRRIRRLLKLTNRKVSILEKILKLRKD